MNRFALVFLIAGACSQVPDVNNYNSTTIVEAPAQPDVDTQVETLDSDVVETTDTDTAPAVDVPDILEIDFTTAWGPIGHIELTKDTVNGVNVGGYLFAVDGDEPVTVAELRVPMWWSPNGDEVFYGYDGWPATEFIVGCQLVNAAPPYSGVVATALIDNMNGELVFNVPFAVEPGPTNGRVMNVICDFVAVPPITPTRFAIELPMMEGVISDADRRPELPGFSYDPGNFNGGEFPSRSVTLPYDRYPGCTTDAWDPAVPSDQIDIQSSPVVYFEESSADTYPSIEWWTPVVTAHVDPRNCDPNYEVAYVFLQVWSSDPDRSLIDMDQALVRMSVNGQATGDMYWNGFVQGTPFEGMGGVGGYGFSWMSPSWPASMGSARATTPLLPMTGAGDLSFEIDPSVFNAQLDGNVAWEDRNPLALNINVYVTYRDIRTGAYSDVQSSIQSLTINW